MLAVLFSHSAGVILNRTVGLGVLNAQLCAVINCKASRQLHSYLGRGVDGHVLIVLNDLCILGIAVQFNLVCLGCGGRYNAVLRSDIQRQRLGCLVIRGRLNLHRGLNVQLLIIALYSSCLFNQSLCSIFIDILNDIARFRAEGRCGNRCRCCCNLFLICLRNPVYLNFRVCNSRLDLNRTGVGLCNYLVAVTGYITGSGNVAACNISARVGGKVAAGNADILYICAGNRTCYLSIIGNLNQIFLIRRIIACGSCALNATIDNCIVADCQIALIASFVTVRIANITIDCATTDFSNIVAQDAVVIFLRLCEYTALNLQFAVIVILDSNFTTSTLCKITAVNGHNCVLLCSVFAAIIPTIMNQAGKCAHIRIRKLKRTLVNVHNTIIMDNIPRVPAAIVLILRGFCAASVRTTIDCNVARYIIIDSSRTVCHVINSTIITVNRQSTLIENGMAINIGQLMTSQVNRQNLTYFFLIDYSRSRNDNILCGIFKQGNSPAVFYNGNRSCNRVIICTCVCDSSVLTCNNSISVTILSRGAVLFAEIGAFTLRLAVCRVKLFKATAGNVNLSFVILTRCIIAVQHKLICLSCIWILLLNRI